MHPKSWISIAAMEYNGLTVRAKETCSKFLTLKRSGQKKQFADFPGGFSNFMLLLEYSFVVLYTMAIKVSKTKCFHVAPPNAFCRPKTTKFKLYETVICMLCSLSSVQYVIRYIHCVQREFYLKFDCKFFCNNMQ